MVYFSAADLEQQINRLSIRTVVVATLILIVVTVLAATLKHRSQTAKILLFSVMAGTMVLSTVVLFGSTIYLNTVSESKGPVHWHADIEFWACGTELELRDPTGFLSNKIGTATYHEHDDKRIHLEGVVVHKSEDASLEKFMRVTGGYITSDTIGIPLNKDKAQWLAQEENDKLDGDIQPSTDPEQFAAYATDTEAGAILELDSGATCGDVAAELQTFVYTFDEVTDTYSQRKLDNPSEYILRDESTVPPGDCVIVEFDLPKERTDKLCLQYGVRDQSRCVDFGVSSYNPELCNIREVTQGGS